MIIGAAALTAALATPARASFIARDYGSGPTAATAQQAADMAFEGDYYGCNPVFPFLISDTQESDGTWFAEVASNCTGYRS